MAEQVITPEMAATIDAIGKLWRPIETAPKDDYKMVVLGADASGDVFAMSWIDSWHGIKSEACWITAYNDEEYGTPLEPTHWMPLPQPPKEEAGA